MSSRRGRKRTQRDRGRAGTLSDRGFSCDRGVGLSVDPTTQLPHDGVPSKTLCDDASVTYKTSSGDATVTNVTFSGDSTTSPGTSKTSCSDAAASLGNVDTGTINSAVPASSCAYSHTKSLNADDISQTKSSKVTFRRLGRQFFDMSCEDLAKALLGQKIVRVVEGVRLCARIVETEAYLGKVDKAAHSYKGQTDRNKAMFMEPGTAYVYSIYGMYCCFNISSRGEGCAVLIRSMEPLEGVDKMQKLKKAKMKSGTAKKPVKNVELTNGPSKLCQALGISKLNLNQRDLVTDPETWLEEGEAVLPSHVVVSTRINIAYAEEWTSKPLRFYVLHTPSVSVRDKAAEKRLKESAGDQDAEAENRVKAGEKRLKESAGDQDAEAENSVKAGEKKVAVSSKTGEKKVKASSVCDKDSRKETVVFTKSVDKDIETTSKYFN